MEKSIAKLMAAEKVDRRNWKQTLMSFPYYLQFMSLTEVSPQIIKRIASLMFAKLYFQQSNCWHFTSDCLHSLNLVHLKTMIEHSSLTELIPMLRAQAQLLSESIGNS